MPSFIADGYTRDDGYIDAAIPEDNGKRLYDALEFVYRPATRLEVIQCDAEVAIALKNREFDPSCAVKAEMISCAFIAKKIISWNLKNAGIHDVAISAEACSRMHPFLFSQLYSIVRGTRESDLNPNQINKPADSEQQKN